MRAVSGLTERLVTLAALDDGLWEDLRAMAGPDHHEDTLMGRRKVVDDPDFW
jgi:hypothetical protein